MKRILLRLALVLAALAAGTGLGSAPAVAAELGDFLWERRPLLLFAPTASDPRLVETLSRIEASRCQFDSRDMVIGVMVTDGTSTLDGHVIDVNEAMRLIDRYAIDGRAFTAVLIGKDGSEKLRVSQQPDLQTIYAVIDGMPMRSRELLANPSRC